MTLISEASLASSGCFAGLGTAANVPLFWWRVNILSLEKQ
jgi:hypothetical protein